MEHTIDAKIELYLSDETQLYQDWYTALTQTKEDEHSQLVGVIPSLSELKKMFEQWIEQHKMAIQQGVCLVFCDYQQQPKTQAILAAAIAEVLTVYFTGMPVNTIVVATILVSEGYLKKWCDF